MPLSDEEVKQIAFIITVIILLLLDTGYSMESAGVDVTLTQTFPFLASSILSLRLSASNLQL